MTSHHGFVWPSEGLVEAPDWKDTDECGHGLHGLPWGVGGDYSYAENDARWLVVRVCTDKGGYRHGTGDMHDKCKFKVGEVVYCGSRKDAVHIIQMYCPPNTPVNWTVQEGMNESTQTAGYKSTQTAGDESTQKAGYKSTQTAGDVSTQTAGYKSTQTAGDVSTQTAGDYSTQTALYGSTQTAGDKSTQTAGYKSTQTAGYKSTQTAGDVSTQTAGDDSTQTAGDESAQTAGDKSTQTAGYYSTQTAGIDTVQIVRYFEGNILKVKTRIITEKEANKPYAFYAGDWHEVEHLTNEP